MKMNYKLFNLAEVSLSSGNLANASNIVINELKKFPGNELWLVLMMRIVVKTSSAEFYSEFKEVVNNFISARVESGKEMISIWPILSKANRLIMRDFNLKNDYFLKRMGEIKYPRREKVKLLMLTCVWQREELTIEFYKYYQRIKNIISKDIDLDIIVVGSEGGNSRELCERFSFNYIEHDNQPLTKKWQAGVDFSSKFDFDALVIMGSDDFVEPSVFYIYEKMVKTNVLFFGFLDLYLYDYKSEKTAYWRGYGSASGGLNQPNRVGETIGLGRMLSKKLLEYLDFDLWRSVDANKSLDGLMKKRVQSATGMLPVAIEDSLPVVVGDEKYHIGQVATTFLNENKIGLDVKHSSNVTDFAKYKLSNESFTFLSKEELGKFPIKVSKHSENKISVDFECFENEKISVAIGIPTFNRGEMLFRLLNQLFSQAKKSNLNIYVFVYDDFSEAPLDISSISLNKQKSVKIYRSTINNGKKKYWKVVNHILDELSNIDADYYFYLPDDIEISNDFFEKSISYWNSIEDSKKITINLLNDGRDECWTKFKRVIEVNSKFELYRSQWVDMAMVFDKKLLRYRVKEIPLSFWDNKPLLSSGVGAQLSKRLHAAGYGLYQVKDSLVFHGAHQSQMNPEERIINPLISLEKNEKSNIDEFHFNENIINNIKKFDFVLLCNSYPSEDGAYKGGEFIRDRVREYRKFGLNGCVIHINKSISNEIYESTKETFVYRLNYSRIYPLLDRLKEMNGILLCHSPVPELQIKLEKFSTELKTIFWFHGSDILSCKRFLFSKNIDKSRLSYLERLDAERKNAAILTFKKGASDIVFVSSYMRESVFSHIGVLPKKNHIIPNNINFDNFVFKEKKIEFRKKIAFIRPFTGNLKYATDLAVDAIKKLSKFEGFDDLEILVQGWGEAFASEVAGLRAFQNVTLVEKYSSPKELAEIFENYGIFFCPTRHDTQGVIMCEAMATGMVCVSSKNSSIPEYIDENCGFLSDSNDASDLAKLLHIATQDEKFLEKSFNSSQRVRSQCAIEKTIGREVELINNLLN